MSSDTTGCISLSGHAAAAAELVIVFVEIIESLSKLKNHHTLITPGMDGGSVVSSRS